MECLADIGSPLLLVIHIQSVLSESILPLLLYTFPPGSSAALGCTHSCWWPLIQHRSCRALWHISRVCMYRCMCRLVAWRHCTHLHSKRAQYTHRVFRPSMTAFWPKNARQRVNMYYRRSVPWVQVHEVCTSMYVSLALRRLQCLYVA